MYTSNERTRFSTSKGARWLWLVQGIQAFRGVPQCSATCGVGTQTRAVECRDLRGRKSQLCDPKRKPRSKQQCSSGNPCFSKGRHRAPATQPTTPTSFLYLSHQSLFSMSKTKLLLARHHGSSKLNLGHCHPISLISSHRPLT